MAPAIEEHLKFGFRYRRGQGRIVPLKLRAQRCDLVVIEIAARLTEKGVDLLVEKAGIDHRKDQRLFASADSDRARSN